MKRTKAGFLFLAFLIVLSSCSVSKNYNPVRKYSPEELRADFSLLREILEAKHPSLYWYTPKDSMDYFFDLAMDNIQDSMTETAFGWKVIAPLVSHIRCGHTSMLMSKEWTKHNRGRRGASFPLFLKIWNDSMLVVASRERDSAIVPGSFVTSINGVPGKTIIDSLFQYLVTDGYSNNLNNIRLSTSFPFIYGNVFGLWPEYRLGLTDSNGVAHETTVGLWMPKRDTTTRERKPAPEKKISQAEIRQRIRSVEYDSSVAIMELNSFTKGRLKQFFRKSFKEIRKENIDNLIIDLRINGGGNIMNAVRLTKYVSGAGFRVADSTYSKARNFRPYTKYISETGQNHLGLTFLSRKRKDGLYHFGLWERHTFKPKKKNHFKGNVYILINGLTFSAASLFCSLVKGQENITLVGEETGGGWYGNSGIMIPDITLPQTGLRVRLPFFRVVQYRHNETVKGAGIPPDWYIGPDWRDVLRGRDTKLEAVLEKIGINTEEQGKRRPLPPPK